MSKRLCKIKLGWNMWSPNGLIYAIIVLLENNSRKMSQKLKFNDQRQIDYGLVCTNTTKYVTDAGTSETIGIGNDHRTVYLRLKLPMDKVASQRKYCTRKKTMRGWTPTDARCRCSSKRSSSLVMGTFTWPAAARWAE